MFRRQDGHALVAVLILSLLLSGLASAYVWRMNADQGQVGRAQRGAAALYLAEAGIEAVLWQLSHGELMATKNGEGSLEGYQEVLGAGRFVVERILETPEGAFEIMVRGEAGDVTRRIRVNARLAPKALRFGLYAGDVAAMVRQARVYVVPLLSGQRAFERLGDIAVARHLWVEEGVTLNALDGHEVALRDGTVHDYTLFGLSSSIGTAFREREVLPDLVGTGDTRLVYGGDEDPLYDLSAMRLKYSGIRVRGLKYESASMPRVDLEIYRRLARENHENAAINKTAGERMRDRLLSEKTDSLYTQQQFEQILWHLDRENRTRSKDREIGLTGVVFVGGMVNIRASLRIDDGALGGCPNSR